ncbi:hypothetical protein NECAME_14216 [Necator americanus]|uniref:Uncharacterized protein n=1 Tax=Necator americanus TaxID=51031 RepID=W2SP84_NECAM|nr:hypothetical protein NECAME_14216 [Necator americanus]ETN71455.1 hypothetical protein NECAME_14216 [Necator americanus]
MTPPALAATNFGPSLLLGWIGKHGSFAERVICTLRYGIAHLSVRKRFNVDESLQWTARELQLSLIVVGSTASKSDDEEGFPGFPKITILKRLDGSDTDHLPAVGAPGSGGEASAELRLTAPPKGATLPYRPKPTFNSLLVASSAAAAAAAQQQQLAALLQPGLLQQAQLAQLLPPELARGVPASAQYGPASAFLPAPTLNPQVFGGLILAGAGGYPTQPGAAAVSAGMPDPSKAAAMTGFWSEDRQLELINQYAALNSSVLLGAPLLKGANSPAGPAHKASGARFTPY